MNSKNYDRMVRVYLKMREKRAELRRQYEEADSKIREQMALIERELLKDFNESGMKNIKTESGTVFITENLKASIADWGSFATWVRENDALEFLEQRVKVGEVSAYLEEHDQLPPGINVYRERHIRIRKS